MAAQGGEGRIHDSIMPEAQALNAGCGVDYHPAPCRRPPHPYSRLTSELILGAVERLGYRWHPDHPAPR